MGVLVLVFLAVLHVSGYLASAQQDLDRCNSCKGACEIIPGLCHCDDQCKIYNDCCGYADEKPLCNETLPPYVTAGTLPNFQCHSVFVDGSEPSDKAFWMVESCPTGWAGSSLEMDCRNNTMFYPVTDMITGLVYSNEHCTACNSATDLVRWRISLVCSDTFLNLTMEQNFSLTISIDLLSSNCHPCSYVEPLPSSLAITTILPRPCYLNTASCVSNEELELRAHQCFTREQYDELVENCIKGPYSPVVSLTSITYEPFRNQYCVVCNGREVTNLVCAPFIGSQLEKCTYGLDTLPGSSGEPPTAGRRKTDDGESFSFVLDIRGDGRVVAESETVTVFTAVFCDEGEVFDPIRNDCRETVCPEGFIRLNEGTCQLIINPRIVECPGRLATLNSSDLEAINNNRSH